MGHKIAVPLDGIEYPELIGVLNRQFVGAKAHELGTKLSGVLQKANLNNVRQVYPVGPMETGGETIYGIHVCATSGDILQIGWVQGYLDFNLHWICERLNCRELEHCVEEITQCFEVAAPST